MEVHAENAEAGKTNGIFNLIKKDSDKLIGKIYLYAKDLNEPKYQILIKTREGTRIKHLNDPKEFIEYSNTKDDIYNNIDDYNPKIKKDNYIFDDMIADINTTNK